jgi:hypothetical protein
MNNGDMTYLSIYPLKNIPVSIGIFLFGEEVCKIKNAIKGSLRSRSDALTLGRDDSNIL